MVTLLQQIPTQMQTDLRTSSDGIRLIKRHEGWMPEWYQDPVGVWTIGWGTTEHVQGVSHPGSPSSPITKEMGEGLLLRALRHAEEAIQDYVTVPLTQGQHDALVSFIYNVGVGLPDNHPNGPSGFRGSTLLAKLNQGKKEAASGQFGRWVYAGGKSWDGLVKRRAEERALFDERDPRALGLSPVRPWEMQELADPEGYILDILERHTL